MSHRTASHIKQLKLNRAALLSATRNTGSLTRSFSAAHATMSPSQSTSYASGQQAPKWPADKPLALQINHFSPVREGHPPPGTVPDEIVAEGEERPLLFHSVQLPVSRLTLKNAIVVR